MGRLLVGAGKMAEVRGKMGQFGFAMRRSFVAQDKHSFLCASGTRCMAKIFSIYVYFNPIIAVNVLQLLNGSEKLP
jgi:hypothetical protein